MKKKFIYIISILIIGSITWGIFHKKELSSSENKNQLTGKITIGTQIGNTAPEIAYPTPTGDTISLSDLKGQMVLIDFWASWCAPCRDENHKLTKIYEKFKNKTFKNGKKFTILSISMDRSIGSWKNAIKQDSLRWEHHISDLKYWNSEPAQIYNVKAIPANFLVDGEGVIIGKNLKPKMLERNLNVLLY